MGSTSKKNPAANLARLWEILPLGATAGSGSSSGAAVTGDATAGMRPIGLKEHVPDFAFVAQPRTRTDDFLNTAFDYHEYFLGPHSGANPSGPRQIRSLAHFLELMNAGAGPIGRIRFVTHAHPSTMMLTMFDGGRRELGKYRLLEFAKGDAEGLATLFFYPDSNGNFDAFPFRALQNFQNNGVSHSISLRAEAVVTRLRQTAGNVSRLAAFGGADPQNEAQLFAQRAVELSFIQIPGNVSYGNGSNPTAISGLQRGILNSLYQEIFVRLRSRIVGQVIAGHTWTDAEFDDALVLLSNLTNDQLFGAGRTMSHSFGVPTFNGSNFNAFTFVREELARAKTAMDAGFRTHLEALRQRISPTTHLDLRGCRVGQETAYLQAFRIFFQKSPTERPVVSGALWYQIFFKILLERPATNAQIQTLLRSGAAHNTAREMSEAFANWGDLAHITAAHKWYWLNLVGSDPVRFAGLEWRQHFPPLQFSAPGLTAFQAMPFRPAMEKIAEFFHVAASELPATPAAWTTLTTFVQTTFPTISPVLLETVNAATPPAHLIELHTQLRAANQTLVAGNVVPAPAASPVAPTVEQIGIWQRDLKVFLESHQLQPIKKLMDAARVRINDDTVPTARTDKGSGWFYYMIHAGLPVFLIRNLVTVNQVTHQVTREHSLFVAHNAFADQAIRDWAPQQWAEPLPAANQVAAHNASQQKSRLVVGMVEKGGPATEGGTRSTSVESPAAFCPHPDYMAQIRALSADPTSGGIFD